MKTKLTMAQRARLMYLSRKRDSAPASERKEIQEEIDTLLGKKPQPNPVKHDSTGSTRTTSTPKSNTKPTKPEAQPKDNPFLSTPHAPYCTAAEIVPIVEIDGEKNVMVYGTFREKFPERNIFDLAPDKIHVMYLNQQKADEYYAGEPDGTTNSLLAATACTIPVEYEPVELAIINGLLYAEAQHDPRIAGSGYEGNNMNEYADAGLFKDFYDGVIYNILSTGMSRDEARAYADRIYQEEVQRAKTVEEVKESSQPAAKDEKSPTPAKDTKNSSGQNPKPVPKKGNTSRSSDFASRI